MFVDSAFVYLDGNLIINNDGSLGAVNVHVHGARSGGSMVTVIATHLHCHSRASPIDVSMAGSERKAVLCKHSVAEMQQRTSVLLQRPGTECPGSRENQGAAAVPSL